MARIHAEETLGANPGDAALNPADSVAMGVPGSRLPRHPERAGRFRALRHEPFKLLFGAFIVNQTGFWISHVSLQGLMVELSDNDTRKNGLLFFALFVPAFLLAPVAGVAADRFDRKRIVLVCYSVICLACAMLVVALETGAMTPGVLLAISAFMGTAFAFSGPANFAIAANTVPDEDLASAVSIQSAANNLTRVAGPLLATPLVASNRFDVSFAVYLLAAGVAACLTAIMRIRRYVPDLDDTGIAARIIGGFHHAQSRPPSVPALVTVAVLSFFGVSHVVLLPAFAQEALGSREFFPQLVAATGIGAMLGALRTGGGEGFGLRWAAVGMMGYGGALLVFAVSRNPLLAMGAQLVVGYFYFAVMTALQTLIQRVVDESKRGRVMSLFQVAWAGLVPFGSLAMGFLAEPLGSPRTVLLAAVVCVAFGAAMAAYAGRSAARYRQVGHAD